MPRQSGEAAPAKDGGAPGRWVWVAAGLLVVLVAATVIWGPAAYSLLSDRDRISAWVAALGPWGPVAIILLQMAQVILAPIPGQAIGAISGYLYGPWLGTLYAMLGVVIGSMLAFLLARRLGRPLVIWLAGQGVVSQLDDLAERGGALFFFLLWVFPFSPDDLVCLAAGLTPMPFRQFLVLMIVGRLSGVFLSVAVGAYATLIPAGLWVGVLIVIALAALVAWRWGSAFQDAMVRIANRFSQ
jgi:uncharacterized membrane protein YdjX (TVP38/TMEM64 family)